MQTHLLSPAQSHTVRFALKALVIENSNNKIARFIVEHENKSRVEVEMPLQRRSVARKGTLSMEEFCWSIARAEGKLTQRYCAVVQNLTEYVYY